MTDKDFQHLKNRMTNMLINITKSENKEAREIAEQMLKRVKYMKESSLYKALVDLYEYSKKHEEFTPVITLLQFYISSKTLSLNKESGKN